jgi:hypothetical protein
MDRPSRVPRPFPGASAPRGNGKVKRVDTRVQKLDLKRKGFPSSARLIEDKDDLYLTRNDKDVNGLKRKVKCRTPQQPVNRPSSNLGRVMKEFPLVRIRSRGPLCGFIARLLQQKTDESFRILSIVQDLLIGVTFESKFYYHACSPYLKGAAGLLLVSRKPSLGATRLILTQLLRIRSSFPFGKLEAYIRNGHGTKVHRISATRKGSAI